VTPCRGLLRSVGGAAACLCPDESAALPAASSHRSAARCVTRWPARRSFSYTTQS